MRRRAREDFAIAVEQPNGRFLWFLRSIAILASPLAHWIKVVQSDRLETTGQRLKAIVVLFRARFWRFIECNRLLIGRQSPHQVPERSDEALPGPTFIGPRRVRGDVGGCCRHSARRGRTPNISRLLERGTGARLFSVKATGDEHYRPETAWPSLATGLHPDRHGVTQFFHEAAETRAPTLWSIYAEHGLSSGIYGWPGGTSPPPQIDGFVVPSHLARNAETWPRSLCDIKSLDHERRSLAQQKQPFRTLARSGLGGRDYREARRESPHLR